MSSNAGTRNTEWIVFVGDSPNAAEVIVECDSSLDYAELVSKHMPGSQIAWRRVIGTGWSVGAPKEPDAP
jgi:hypothetical protein